MTRKARKPTRIFARAYVAMLGNPKLVALSHLAWRLYVSSWIRCREEANDGQIHPGWLLQLVPGETKRNRSGALIATPQLEAAKDELLDAGLWDADGTPGWVVHDYLEHQDGSKKIADSKAQAAQAAGVRWENQDVA